QIAAGRFAMIGSGSNLKSMAYVGNVAGFCEFLLRRGGTGLEIYNYADKPDLSVAQIVDVAAETLGVRVRRIPCPRFAALLLGRCGDALRVLLRRDMPVTYERVRKFLADTRLPAERVRAAGFVPQYPLLEAFRNTVRTEFPRDLGE
ncbi:MAG: UDP-N-acetylglucosamine 4-epimerase, partial [Pseudomonadota bacterium]